MLLSTSQLKIHPKAGGRARHLSWHLQTFLLGPGLPHIQSCRINALPAFFLLALGPCPQVTPRIKPPHVPRGWRGCTCPGATADLSRRGDSVCSGLFRRAKASSPLEFPLPPPFTQGRVSFGVPLLPLPFAGPYSPACCPSPQLVWLQPLVPSKLSRNWIISYCGKPRWSFCDAQTEEINHRD